jgi:hypothetical protein
MRMSRPSRLIVVGGHTRSIGKTQLVCDLIHALPDAHWVAGKITQYGHGVCATYGRDCDCAPTEHIVAFDWESTTGSVTDSERFLSAGASRSFWLRTKQGFLAEGMPRLREALAGVAPAAGDDGVNLIIESNSLLQFVKPSLYLTVIDTTRDDFKDSARLALDRADALVFRGLDQEAAARSPWLELPAQLVRQKPSVIQRQGEPVPELLVEWVKGIFKAPASVFL